MRSHSKIIILLSYICSLLLVEMDRVSSIALTNLSAAESGVSPKMTKELFLVKDVPQTLSFDYDIGEIAIGNPGVVSVVADRVKRRIVLSPLEAGDTALIVFDADGKQRDNVQITVTSADLDQFVRDLKFLFRDIEGLSFRRVGRKIIIEGEVYLKSDLDRIREVLRGNDFVVDLVSLSQDTQRILARRIKDEINVAGVEVTTTKDRIVLKGEVTSEEESARLEKLAAIYVDKSNIVNALAVNPKKQGAKAAKLIQVSAYFVELNKSFFRNFNFSWTPIANVQFSYGPGVGGTRDYNFFAVVTEFLPKLNMAKALGVARVFENPTVSVKSGENASIFSGGTLLIPIQNEKGETRAENVNTGVTLNVTPAVDDRDFIDLKVGVDVSKLGSSPVQGGVYTTSSKVNTSHYIRSGETVALGGVLRSAFSDIKDAQPGSPFAFQPAGADGPSVSSSFGNIFQLFKSRATNMDRNMVIVFITPEVLVSARDSGRNVKEHMNLNSLEAGTQGSEAFE